MQFMQRVESIIGWIGAILLAVVVVIGTYEVAMRYVFNAPSSWVHVTSTTLCVIVFAISGAYAMLRGTHMRVTVLVDRWSAGKQRAALWLGYLCGLLYLLGLGWGLWREAYQAVWRFQGALWMPELTPGPPNWPLPSIGKAALCIGCALFLIAVIGVATRGLKRAFSIPAERQIE
jgi:TRAP-type C4-dicarboxylate transport system permease small subunit